MKAMVGFVTGVVLAAACASAPAQPRPVDPVGTFDFSTAMEGQPISGTIEIRSGTNGYAGTLSTNVTEPIPITAVSVEGQVVYVTASAPDGQVNLTMTFTGGDFTGGWTYAGMSGQMTGKRRTSDG